jgi:hypothetical protein
MDPVLYAQTARDRQLQIRSTLPAESRVVRAINEYEAKDQAGGCRGCRRRRMLRWLANEIALAPGTEKSVVDSVVAQV